MKKAMNDGVMIPTLELLSEMEAIEIHGGHGENDGITYEFCDPETKCAKCTLCLETKKFCNGATCS
ncbi:MAG: hypothetical protein K2M67_08385 [Muribaculaceae bacterium]|nr:hypothetical protein [Muribaculaceae bacterium]